MQNEIDTSYSTTNLKDSMTTCRRVLAYVWQIDKLLFSLSIIAVSLPAVIPFINLYIYKLLTDFVVHAVATGEVDYTYLSYLFAVRITTYFLQDVGFKLQNFIDRLLWTKVPIFLYNTLFKKVAYLDAYYFEDPEFKNLLERVRQNYAFRPQNLVSDILYSLQSLIQLIISFITIINLNWFFIILISLVAIPEFLIQNQHSKLSWGIFGHRSPLRRRFSYLTTLFESYHHIKEIKLYKLINHFLGEIRTLQTKFYEDNISLAKKSLRNELGFNLISTFVYTGIEIYVILEVLAKRLTVGDIAFYTGIVSRFEGALNGLFRNLNGIYEHSLYAKDIFTLLDLQPKVQEAAIPITVDTSKPPRIAFINVNFRYPGQKKDILHQFNLDIRPGEKIAFVGENGAGKSTIIKLLARFYDVDSGQITINGIDIKQLSFQDLYALLGVLFQDFNRYEDTVKSNVHYGDISKDPTDRLILSSIQSAGGKTMVRDLPQSLEQMLGRTFDGGLELSGGQWQKIALARAFFRNAPVLILDEPTSAIDAKAENQIFTTVEKLSRDKTVIIISHRFSTVRNADRIIVLDQGKVIESGTHQDLIQQKGHYAKLFSLQAKGYQ